MNALLIALTLAVSAGIVFLIPSEGPSALAVSAAVVIPTILILSRQGPERTFLLRIFIVGLLIRLVVGTIIYVGHMEAFFGGDANTYDTFGGALNMSWHGDAYAKEVFEKFMSGGATAWGMLYLVAGVYEMIGRNMLAIQFINAAIGAATAAVIYYTAQHLFSNIRVSRIAALLTCFFPSLILWSSQALKDAIIVLALALAMHATVHLVERVRFNQVLILSASLVTLLSLRFYIFYMMAAAVAGAFALGVRSLNAQSFIQRFLVIAVIGLAFTWFGVINSASTQFERFGNLQAVQNSRLDAAQTAQSGFAKDVDVRTTGGALTAIPIGIIYLLFAPFPWQLTSMRQSITIPEMLVWWFSFPMLVLGIWFAIKHKLRTVAPILLFTTMLTLAYSLFQGNVGTAYRQRSQLLVFYFIFVAVGWVLLKERSEERQLQRLISKEQVAELIAARASARKASDRTTTNTALRSS